MNVAWPAPIVGALVINSEKRMLLVQSPMWNNQYIIPGGHVEFGETLETALKREIKEETNLDIHSIQFLLFIECIYPNGLKEKHHFIFFDFVCRTENTQVLLNEEATNYVWVAPEESLSLPVEHYTRMVIERYMQKM